MVLACTQATGINSVLAYAVNILQQAGRISDKDKRVGHSVATFHVTPKVHHKTKRERKTKRA